MPWLHHDVWANHIHVTLNFIFSCPELFWNPKSWVALSNQHLTFSSSLRNTSLETLKSWLSLSVAFLPFTQGLKRAQTCLNWYHYEFVASKFTWVFSIGIDISLICFFFFFILHRIHTFPFYSLVIRLDIEVYIYISGITSMFDPCIRNSPANITIGRCFLCFLWQSNLCVLDLQQNYTYFSSVRLDIISSWAPVIGTLQHKTLIVYCLYFCKLHIPHSN